MTLPYPEPEGAGFTAGWAGSEASHDRALREATEATKHQTAVLERLAYAGRFGLTWAELGHALGWHHGRSSSVLSVLHKVGRIDRLRERRNGSSIYVLPQFVDGRVIALPGRTKGNARSYAEGYAAGYSDGTAANQ